MLASDIRIGMLVAVKANDVRTKIINAYRLGYYERQTHVDHPVNWPFRATVTKKLGQGRYLVTFQDFADLGIVNIHAKQIVGTWTGEIEATYSPKIETWKFEQERAVIQQSLRRREQERFTDLLYRASSLLDLLEVPHQEPNKYSDRITFCSIEQVQSLTNLLEQVAQQRFNTVGERNG